MTSIREKIDDFLSLVHRFLSPSVFNVSRPLEAFSSLSTRIKWKVFFAHKQTPSDLLERNPQYRIPKPETIAVPASTPKWVEDILDRGRTELTSPLGALPDSAKNAVITPSYKSKLKCLKNWRNMNNVLVLQSDKNLGTTVVCAEWYNKKLDALVLVNSDFTEIIDYRGKFIPVFDEIRRCENKHLRQEVKDLILAGWNIKDVKLPRFHGLPKIHMEPGALRQIVPCHSSSAIIRVCTDIVRHAVTCIIQSDMTDTTPVKHPVRPTFQVRHVLRNLRPGGETGGDTYSCLQARTPLLERWGHVRKEW